MDKELYLILGIMTAGLIKYFLCPVLTAVVSALILNRVLRQNKKKK